MKNIKFPFITLIFTGILLAVFILNTAVRSTQQSAIAEEEMRVNSLRGEIFNKYFTIDFTKEVKRGDLNFINYAKRIYEEFIRHYFSSDDFRYTQDKYRVRMKAARESLEAKRSNFILNALGNKKREDNVKMLISSATSLFIHLNPLHLVLSIALLWMIGINAEKLQGMWYFLLLLGGGVAFNFLGPLIGSPDVLYFGLAPGIAVVLGAYLYHNYDEDAYLIFPGVGKVYGIFLVVPWIIMEVILALQLHNETYHTFSFMHIGALFGGVILALLFGISKPLVESHVSSESITPIENARRNMKMGNYQGAFNILGDILRKDSTNEPALKLMLQGYLSYRNQQDCEGFINYIIPELVNKGKNKLAFDLYMDFSSSYPKSVLPLRAQYYAGKLLAENDFYEMAVDALTKVTQASPGSEESIESVFEIGRIQLEKLNQPQNAVAMFNWLLQYFPNHRLAPQARQLLQRARQMGG